MLQHFALTHDWAVTHNGHLIQHGTADPAPAGRSACERVAREHAAKEAEKVAKPRIYVGTEPDDAYRNRIYDHYRACGVSPQPNWSVTCASGKALDEIGRAMGVSRRGSDLPTNAPLSPWRCSCGKPVQEAGQTCKACARAMVEIQFRSDLRKRYYDAGWLDYSKLIDSVDSDISRTIYGVDPAVPAEPTTDHTRSRLARIFGMSQSATEDQIVATVEKVWIGNDPRLAEAQQQLDRMRADINVANRMRETVVNENRRLNSERAILIQSLGSERLEAEKLRKARK